MSLQRFVSILAFIILTVTASFGQTECVGDCQITESALLIDKVKVVGAQQPAIANSNGTLESATTTANLLLDALRRHGLIEGTATPVPPPPVMHKVSLRSPFTQTIPNSEWTPVYFNAEYKDTDSMHSNTVNPHIVKINTAGDYDATAVVCFSGNDTGARGIRFVFTTPAGAIEVQGPQVRAVGDGRLTCIGFTSPSMPLPVGATVEVRVWHDAAKRDTVDTYPGRSSFGVGMR